MKKTIFFGMFFAVASIVLFSFVNKTEQTPWEVPAKYVKMENPVAADDESLDLGKKLYNQHCKSCHGKEGWGDGSKAAQLDTPAGDFSVAPFTEQTDGEIFYKSKFGRDEMPSFEKKIPYDEDIWAIVNYMRTFAE